MNAPQDTLDHSVTGKTMEVPSLLNIQEEIMDSLQMIASAYGVPFDKFPTQRWEHREYTLESVTWNQYMEFRKLVAEPTEDRIIDDLVYHFTYSRLEIKERIRIKQ